MEERDNYKRAIASYNPDLYSYGENGNKLWNADDQYYDCQEENKYSTENQQVKNRLYSIMPQKKGHPTPFHSAINPLEDYHEENDEKYRRNQFQKLADQNQRDDEINPDEKLSSGDENDIEYSQDSNMDKPRSIDNNQQRNSHEFRGMGDTLYSKQKEQNMNPTIEEANKIMNDISQEMKSNDNSPYMNE